MGLWPKKVEKVLRLYVIYDRAGEECSPPMVAVNDTVALRSYRQALQNVDPIDQDSFLFFCVGSLDVGTMRITPMEPAQVCLPDSQIELIKEGKNA